jgi:hypothetical protein
VRDAGLKPRSSTPKNFDPGEKPCPSPPKKLIPWASAQGIRNV